MWNESASTSVATSQQVPMTGMQAKRKRDEADEHLGLPASKQGRTLVSQQGLHLLHSSWPPDHHHHSHHHHSHHSHPHHNPCHPCNSSSDLESDEDEDDEEEEDMDELMMMEPEPRASKPPLYRTPAAYPCSAYPMDPKPYFSSPPPEHATAASASVASGGGGEQGGGGTTTNVNTYGGGAGAPYRPDPYCPPPRFSRTAPPSSPQPTSHPPPQQQQQQQQQQHYWPSPQYCYPSEPPPVVPPSNQQTIRCAENGKSYLELGASPTTVVAAAGSTNKCSRTANYRQQRLAVLNISMCKLSRFRQFPDPSLHRSVLICNTLRRIEREMEHDTPALFCSEVPPPPPPPPPSSSSSSSPSPPQAPPTLSYPTAPSYPATPPPPELPHYEHSLRDLASPAPRATPFPSPAHPGSDSADSASTINWGSVLSLSSQSDLDPLNNNALDATSPGSTSSLLDELDSELLPSWRLTPLSADDVLKSVPPGGDLHQLQRPSVGAAGEELDTLMHVLVGT